MASLKLRGFALSSVFLATWSGFASTALADPPYDDQLTPGELRGVAHHVGDAWPLGYWEYLPDDYEALGDDELLPLLVFLPGIGEYDDDSSCPSGTDTCAWTDCGSDGLCRNLSWGPQLLVRTNVWDDDLRPFIMVSPQNPVPPGAITEWDLDELDAFFQYVIDNYPVDPRRLYLTGMSQGGRGTIQYVAEYPRRFAAAASMPGGQVAAGSSCAFQDTAFWWFHGEDDNDGHLGPGVFNPCLMVELSDQYDNPGDYPQYPECVTATGQPRPDGRMTMFNGVGHSAWVPAIDPIGSGFASTEWSSDEGCGFAGVEFREYSAANDSDGVYSWFLGLDRPDVTAPDDFAVPGDGVDVELTATVVDDDAVAYTWTQTGGPAAVLTNADAATLTVSDLAPLTAYTFQVYVLDADNQWDLDEVVLDVQEMPVGTESSSSGSGGGEGEGSITLTTSAESDSESADSSGGSGGASAGTQSGSASNTGGVTQGSGADASADGSGDSSGSEDAGGSENDPGSSCACSSSDRGGAWAWMLVVAPMLRRRRR